MRNLVTAAPITSTVRGLRSEVSVGVRNVIASVVHPRGQVDQEMWLLPDRAFDRADAWLRAALAQWKVLNPSAFPTVEWASQLEWMDAAQRKMFNELAEHDQKTSAAIRDMAERRGSLTAEMERVTAAAETGLLRLLTSQSDGLVEAVSTALELLGFAVTNSDQIRPGEKFEDLLVTDHDWSSVAEVKGYSRRNAKSNDLYQVQKAVMAYALQEGRLPSARWYVINQSFETAPPLRRKPLHSSPETVAIFAADDGLVIDTRDLFQLAVKVQEGNLEPAAARDLLKTAVGVFIDPQSKNPENT